MNRYRYIILNDLFSDITFDSVESATRAKEALHGCDIYSGCCTLKIDFAKPTKLNVYKNDAESWDYTTPALEYFWSLFYHQYFANAAIATDAILVLASSQLGLILYQPLYYFYFQLIASYPPQASSIPHSGILPYCVIPDMHQHSFIAISRLQPISIPASSRLLPACQPAKLTTIELELLGAEHCPTAKNH
ncbi:hypothetical protein KQX54_006756 [Cotesia glomerata]|uniref:Uncharacterized protein n=1 Tax=Cotesia glomerata TaxID=32391 RepID=A0AAV7I7P2_COTGL|nr:hypothetical protein KQX54_006756 [Cotesia glomerata]